MITGLNKDLILRKVRILPLFIEVGFEINIMITFLNIRLFMLLTKFSKKAHFLDQGGIFIKIPECFFDQGEGFLMVTIAILNFFRRLFFMIESTFLSNPLKFFRSHFSLSPTYFLFSIPGDFLNFHFWSITLFNGRGGTFQDQAFKDQPP